MAGLLIAFRACGAGFEERRMQMLQAAVSEVESRGPAYRPGWADCFPLAEAMFASGRVEDARRLAHIGLDALSPGNPFNRWHENGNSGFAAWPGMDCYLRFNRDFDDALREHYRKVYGGAVFYRRMTTSNHTLMAAVTRYLATQVWGPGAFQADPYFKDPRGSVFTKDDPTGEKFVRERIAAALRDAPGEYASRPYGAQNILPFLTVADCSTDKDLAASARRAYERCLFQLAPAWLDGHLATFSLRSYPDMLTQQPWGLGNLLWLYFGGIQPARIDRGYAMIAAVSSFRAPRVVEEAAADRGKPYVYRSLVSQWALYHFVNRSYVLFSHSPKRGGKPWMNGQVYPAGVMWSEPDTNRTSQLWITNPAADQSDDPNFRPEGIHTHGVSKYGREVQFRDAWLSVFDIDRSYRFPHLLGFVPGGFRAVTNESATSGRIFLDYGSVLVAITASQPFPWDPNGGMRSSAGPARPGDSQFLIPLTRGAVAIETAHPDEFAAESPSERLEKFRRAVTARSRLTFDDVRVAGSYTDRFGNTVECVFAGEDRINGHSVDYKKWPLMESPWSEAFEAASQIR